MGPSDPVDGHHRAGLRLGSVARADHRRARREDERVGAERREDLRDHRLPRAGRGGVGHARSPAGPRRHQVVPGREGHARLRRRAQGEEARHPRRRHRRLRVPGLPHPARQPARRQRGHPEGELGRLPRRDEDLQHDATRAVAAFGLGMSQAALDFTREQLDARPASDLSYGAGVHGLSAAAKKFQQLEALQEAALLTVLRAAWLSDQSQPNNLEASVSKAKARLGGARRSRRAASSCSARWASRASTCSRSGSATCASPTSTRARAQIQHLIIARTILGYGRERAEVEEACSGGGRAGWTGPRSGASESGLGGAVSYAPPGCRIRGALPPRANGYFRSARASARTGSTRPRGREGDGLESALSCIRCGSR